MRSRFEGEICSFGSSSGHRAVIGCWSASPFGTFADVMLETPDGERILFAPDDAVAGYVGATYTFDDVVIGAVTVERRRDVLRVESGRFEAEVVIGARTGLGRLLRCVPTAVATSTIWAAAVDPVARVAVSGVRTRGSAGNGRREWYGATDMHAVNNVSARLDDRDLGAIADVWPPVTFGFGSAPRRPSIVAVTTTVEVPG